MEPAQKLSDSISLGPTRAGSFLHRAGLDPAPEVQCLVKLPTTDFQSSLPEHVDATRTLLVQHRITSPNYRQPDQQKRDFFRRTQRKREVRDETLWTFTKHEVARTFGELLSREPLAPPGVAQALLSHASVSCLEELWSHFHDSKLEKRMNSRFRKSRASLVPEIPWLDSVTDQENVDYVRLMCQVGLDQEALDRAFAIALARHSMDVMELLLTFGASASTCQERICEHIQRADIALARLLLSAPPSAMSVEAWRHCLCEEVTDRGKRPPSILLLCLANQPRIVCGPLLLRALESQNLQATAALLAYANEESGLGNVGQSACDLASHVQDAGRRHEFFTLLADSGLVADGVVVREELMTDVKARHFPLLRLLVDAGVALDVEPHNAVAHAVSNMDFDMLEWFQGGRYHTPAALALNSAPASAPEPQLLRLIDILEPRRLEGKPLDTLLVRAARKGHAKLVERLLGLGASVEYEAACAIRGAVEIAHFGILDTLLRKPCSPTVLYSVLPTAMALQARPSRRRAIEALIGKGVLKQELGVSLQSLVSEADSIDSELVHILLQHGAPVDGVGDETTNAVLQVARRCNLAVLLMLCDARPKSTTLSKAVPVAFEARHVCGYEAALETISLLLKRGAVGTPVHETLLAAAVEDHKLDIVRVLIEHGAEANFANGAAFSVGLETDNLKLLEILCLGCPPSRASTECVLYTAIDPQHYSSQVLELLLNSTRCVGAALDAAWDSDKLHGNPNLNTIVPCFLQYGLNVDLREGALLRFALQETDINLLSRILSSGPSIGSLTAAFKVASSVEAREIEIEAMSLLLETAQSAEIGQSRGLLPQTCVAFSGDFAGLELLLRHKAAIDFDDGAAVRAAASVGDIEVLDCLLGYGPALPTLYKACLAAAESTLSFDQKRPVFDSLLDARDRELTEAKNMSQLLVDSVTKLPDHTQLPVLLITRGAKVQFKTFQVAMRTSSRDLFKALANVQKTSTLTDIFKEARKTPMASERKYWIYEFLLSRGIPREEVSIALVDSLQRVELGDMSVPKLLLEHEADVGYRKCAAFDRALCANSATAVQLLSQYLVDDDTACIAFDLARKAATLSPSVRAEVYYCLLQWNIGAPSIYGALVSYLEHDHSDVSVVQLLLAKGADPNQEAALCFVLAAAGGAELIYRALSQCANLSVVLRALMDHFSAEWEVLVWFNTCLEEQHHSATIDEHDLLYQCMLKFPAGSGLLRVLLERGVSPATPIEKALTVDWQLEQCTPLIWAILAKQIDNDTILTLLDRGGHEAWPMYSTPRTSVTAAFACLLDKTRTPILQALLNLDRKRTLECSTPASTFRYFGAGEKEYVLDGEDGGDGLPIDLPLPSACMMLGNFDAYRAMGCEETPEDANLHVAALMALPRFVEWLLVSYDPNAKIVGEFDQMIPLALACTSEERPWCKIASQEADFATRQKECIMLLAPKTNLNWRYRNKTVLHIALDNGPDVARVMIEALNVRHDPQRNDKYLLLDKNGIQYSPDEYVLKFMEGVGEKEKEGLVQYLRQNKIESRYFRSVMPDEGIQPPSYHGLPPGYAKAWEAHEKYLAYQGT